MTKVLTIEREFGSGAATIAKMLAKKLGWQLWDQLLTDEICRRMQCDRQHLEQQEERRDPLHYRFFKAFLRGSFEGSLNTPKMKIADAAGIRQMTEQLVREAAAKGDAVIVGRGSAYYLHDRPDAFHVFIYAPFEEKVRRLQLDGKTQEEAIQLVESVDRDRAAFIREHFDVVWPARHFFDLMINSTLGEEVTAQVIVESLRVVEDSKTGPLKPQ